MTIPNQSQQRWAYIAEVTAGTTPATPAWQKVRVRAGATLKINRPRQESSELRSDRKLGSTFGGIGGGSANLPTLLFHETFQHDLLEAALCGTWTDDVLLDGVVRRSKSFERMMPAGANNIFDRLKGGVIGGMRMSVVPNTEVTVDYDVMALDGVSDSAIIAGATYVDAEIGENADFSDVSAVSLFGLTNFSLVRLELGLTNNLRGQPKIASKTLAGIGMGNCRVTGRASIYLEDPAYYAAALANTKAPVAFTIGPAGGDAGARYTFSVPNAEIGDHNADPSSGDGILDLSFTALVDETTGAQLSIERNA